MDERVRFVPRLLEGDTMAALCEEFGISRKTGYKIYRRYRDFGVRGLSDRSRRPYRHANQLPLVVEKAIVRLKKEVPTWGAPKIRERLRQRCPEVACPAISTVHAVLDRHGLVARARRRRRPRLTGTTLTRPLGPNALWCADYKGEFLLGNRRDCYPLTITDFASRYLLACEALSTTKERYAFPVFERAFQEFGLPAAMRASSAAGNTLQQQGRFDTFAHEYNRERPHQALDMATPASRYQASARPYTGLEELDYPAHDWAAVITTCGRICYQRRKINVSQVFAGQKVGVKQTDDHLWLVTFMEYDLGYFDDETCRLEERTPANKSAPARI